MKIFEEQDSSSMQLTFEDVEKVVLQAKLVKEKHPDLTIEAALKAVEIAELRRLTDFSEITMDQENEHSDEYIERLKYIHGAIQDISHVVGDR